VAGSCQIVKGCRNAAAGEWHAAGGKTHFDAAQRPSEHQIAEIAQMADAEQSTSQLSESGSERHVEALENDVTQAIGVVSVRDRLRADRVEPEAGGKHQSLLRSADRDVDAPLLVAVLDRAERRDRVDQQERWMPDVVDLPPHLADATGDAGRRLIVNDRDGF